MVLGLDFCVSRIALDWKERLEAGIAPLAVDEEAGVKEERCHKESSAIRAQVFLGTPIRGISRWRGGLSDTLFLLQQNLH
jgi:hypothetical protein